MPTSGSNTTTNFYIQATAASTVTTVVMASGSDSVSVGVSSNVQSLAGNLIIQGANGAGAVVLDDGSDPTARTVTAPPTRRNCSRRVSDAC